MDKNRKIAIIVGILIILAYSLVGTGNPDAKIMGMFLEVISGISVITIAVLMFPLLNPYGKNLSIWYLTLKGIEGLIAIVAGVLFLINTTSLLNLRDQMYLIHGYIFAVPALMLYFLLYKSKLIPRWLSVWGIVASAILIIVNLLEVVGVISTIEILYLPIVLNEAVLAMWLILKGFNLSAIKNDK